MTALKFNLEKVWYTADLHLGHANIIKYCNRPFANVEEMDRVIIQNWNSVVSKNDNVVFIGDFAHHKIPYSFYLKQLNGKIHFVRGNHDSDDSLLDLVRDLHNTSGHHIRLLDDIVEISDHGEHLVVCHYGMRVWNRSHHGSIQLYGHSHNMLPGNSQSLDVGVDCWNFFPVSLAQIKQRLAGLIPYPYAREVIPKNDDYDSSAKALRQAVNESAPWKGLVDNREWDALSDEEQDHYRQLIKRTNEIVKGKIT